MERLAVCGWDDEIADVLHALRLGARLAPVAVGDRQAARLVRARTATGLACYQHLLEMLRAVDVDAVLVTDATQADELAEVAARRGADLLLDGDAMDGSALMSAVGAARRHDVALAVLRPSLQAAAPAFLAALVASDAAWRPRFLAVDVARPASAVAALREAAALAVRLLPDAPAQAMASAIDPGAGAGLAEATAIAAQVRCADGAVATLTARTAATRVLRVVLEAPAGTAEIVSADGGGALTLTDRAGRAERSELEDGDLLAIEAARVADVRRGDSHDMLTAGREAVLLRALEQAARSGYLCPVEDAGVRSTLRVLDGGAVDASAPRRGHLHLVAT